MFKCHQVIIWFPLMLSHFLLLFHWNTIGLVLERIYNKGELVTKINRSKMKEMLLLCTKNVHFSYNHDIYIQTDAVAMGSSLGLVLAGIFMVKGERSLVPKLNVNLNF